MKTIAYFGDGVGAWEGDSLGDSVGDSVRGMICEIYLGLYLQAQRNTSMLQEPTCRRCGR